MTRHAPPFFSRAYCIMTCAYAWHLKFMKLPFSQVRAYGLRHVAFEQAGAGHHHSGVLVAV